METLWVTMLVVLLATTTLEANSIYPSLLESSTTSSNFLVHDINHIFTKGRIGTTMLTVPRRHTSRPPEPLLVVSPTVTGSYPILFFIHGTKLLNTDYSNVFEQIASHGFIVLAPQLWSTFNLPRQAEEIEMAASVLNWLPSELENVLPKDVKGDLSKLAVSGHSRGGKSAFALALGKSTTTLSVTFSALLGVDPVAGRSKNSRTTPYVLTYVPNSFDLSIPIVVIGTGLGNRTRSLLAPACAPNDVSHEDFFNEGKKGEHFVISDYGHMDMLNDRASIIPSSACVSGRGSRNPMRTTLGGIIVAFLNANFLDEGKDYATLLNDPSLAPTKLHPVQVKSSTAKYFSA